MTTEVPHPPGAYEIEASPSGNLVDLFLPDPASIALGDVATHLGNCCRYAGGVRRFYSVAEHAVLVARKLVAEGHPELALAGLHHDDAEAYLGDVTRPLKLLLAQLSEGADHDLTWLGIEATMDSAIWTALSGDPARPLWELDDFSHPLVKTADNWALLLEAKHLKVSGGLYWTKRAEWAMELAEEWPLDAPTGWACGLYPENATALYLQEHAALVRRQVAAA